MMPNDSIAPADSGFILIPETAVPAAVMKLDTAMFDMTASDNAVCDSIELTPTLTQPDDNWQSGLEGTARQGSTNGNSGILTIIVVLFVAISLNFKECRKLIIRFADELRNNKRRENAFDEHTNHETRLTLLTFIQYVIYGGIILAGLKISAGRESDINAYDFSTLIKNISLFAGYYLFQVCAYNLTGYIFASGDDRKRWLRAFNASQSLAGIALMIPALILLFYPQSTPVVFIVAAVIYLTARLTFISKGFSIFYNNIFSLVYFILYLCALEIIPLIYVLKLALLI